VSDKDFFFDEEPDEPAPDKAASKSGARPVTKAGSASASPTSVTSSDETPLLERNTTVMIAVLVGVVGLLLGIIVGYLLGGSTTAKVAPAARATTSQTGASATGD
jgi:hypothetical protein